MIVLTILVFLIILGLLIFVHEVGHFVMAKRAGMKVEEFGFGFPPRIFGVRRGETIYSVNWIPLGGFVRILGEDGGHHENPRAFGNKSFGARFKVLVAGVAMNFLLGWFLLFLGFAAIGTPAEIADNMGTARVRSQGIVIVGIQKDSPAEAADFRPGDAILSVDGTSYENIPELVAYSKSKAGTPVVYELKRGDEIFKKEVVPRKDTPEGVGPVGFAPAKIGIITYPLLDALRVSISSFFERAGAILAAFGILVKSLLTSGKLIEGLTGPVGIAVLTRSFVELGFVYIVQFAAILSINLGVINGFPFPALDGGRVLFLLIEKIRGTKSVKWEQFANVIGFLLLILLMIAVTFRDVGKLERVKEFFERIL